MAALGQARARREEVLHVTTRGGARAHGGRGRAYPVREQARPGRGDGNLRRGRTVR